MGVSGYVPGPSAIFTFCFRTFLIVKLFAVMLRLVVQDVLWLVPAIYRGPDLVQTEGEPNLPSAGHT